MTMIQTSFDATDALLTLDRLYFDITKFIIRPMVHNFVWAKEISISLINVPDE